MIAAHVFRVLLPVFLLLIADCGTPVQHSGRLGSASSPGPVPPVLPAVGMVAEEWMGGLDPGRDGTTFQSPKTQSIQDSPVAIRAALSHSAYSMSTSQSLLLKVDYSAITQVPANRPPLNIALVLDRSGSMAEDRKFPYTLEAARRVVENMTDQDILSIIAFNDEVVVLSAAGRVVNKPFLFHRLEEISPEGYTDLSAGLLEGIAQVSSQRAEGQVQQVLLLTDGLANRGITDSAALRKIAEKASARGIGVSTFGTGTAFNERLLADMAAVGGGRYTYVKSPEQIPMAFKDELRGLLQVVAQNMVVEVVVTGGRISKVYGELLEQPTLSYKLNIGNLLAGQRGTLLMELKPSNFGSGAPVDAEVRFTFDDPQAGERVKGVVRQRASFTTSRDPDELMENQDVVLFDAMLNALEQAEEAVKGLDTERFRQVQAVANQLYERARQRAIQNRDQELLNQAFLLKHLMEELAAAEKQGLLHGHREAHEKLTKEIHYQRYLLTHHRPPP